MNKDLEQKTKSTYKNRKQTELNNSSRESKINGYFTQKGKKIYFPIFISLAILFVVSVILILTINPALPPEEKGQKSSWPDLVVAPFVDMSSWVPLSNQFSKNGVPNVALVEEQTGIKYYNLGFIQPDQTKPLDSNGNIRWGWGGYYELSEAGNDGYQYPEIKKALNNLKSMGASFAISVGGQLGKAPWVVTENVDKLEAFYSDIIDVYGITRLDLDIEESNQGESGNIANAKAIKRVQDSKNIEVVLTIPIMPNGWADKQIKIIRAYLSQGVKIDLINSMTMCYGSGVYESEDYGDASIRAIENSVRQMQEIWASYGTTLTEKQAYKKTGATVDIGYESDLYPIFTTEMTQKVVKHAKQKGYGMLSYWSLNRDAKMEENKGVGSQYEFLKQYSSI
ncbi:MAG: chitinase [Clostridia bacterium]|nr:chitinase [Clostridia bacterium]